MGAYGNKKKKAGLSNTSMGVPVVVVFYLMTSHTKTVPPEATYPEDINPPNLKGTSIIERAVKSLKCI